MDTHSLSAFLVLSEILHFGRAAEQCHLSPSALSRLIQRLEEEAGARLFLRDNRAVRLTGEGERFRSYAREALARWEECKQSLRHGELEGELRLFCSVTASYHFLMGLLPRFRDAYPGIEIHLHTGDQAESVQRVLSGEADMAIAALGDAWPQRLAFLPLASTPLLFVRPAMSGSMHAFLAPEAVPDWQTLPLIVAERGISRERFDAWCRESGMRPPIYARVAGHEAIVGMVGLGYGIGLVPELVLANSPLRDRVEPCPGAPALPPVIIGLCADRRNLGNSLVQAFWREAEQVFGGQPQGMMGNPGMEG